MGGWCLKRAHASYHSSSHLFDHLLIPAGAYLTIQVDLSSPTTKDRPRSLDNLRHHPNFTTITTRPDSGLLSCGQFSGSNGEAVVIPQVNETCLVLEPRPFETSKTERLAIKSGKSSINNPLSESPPPHERTTHPHAYLM